MIHRFLDAGGNHIDTADVYAAGRSEEIVGNAIASRRDEVVLATKVRFRMGDGPNDQGSSRHHILSGVDASLQRLGTDHIDLLYLHCWDPITPLDESLRALDDLVTVLHAVAGSNSPRDCRRNGLPPVRRSAVPVQPHHPGHRA
jgi:aryl-alcohol dehydrogenase-like predicted oxidoreductase